MDRALDLKPEVTQGCGFESRLRQEVHDCSPGCTVGCPLLQVCTLGWVKCREHISLLIILCIIVYVTNKAHPSLICLLLLLVATTASLTIGFSLSGPQQAPARSWVTHQNENHNTSVWWTDGSGFRPWEVTREHLLWPRNPTVYI